MLLLHMGLCLQELRMFPHICGTYQSTDNFYRTLIAGIATSTHQHRQEECHHNVILQNTKQAQQSNATRYRLCNYLINKLLYP